ncbi:hypothetical protein [Ruania zhangjianzhongii]|uniref:hypothetical protein n=1 Tax=Ruania zhangjianzhongii TaxID=2603206 RepID=UPI00143CD0D4|nr:hypothetical protein [Ruania zhangjianzhongii]
MRTTLVPACAREPIAAGAQVAEPAAVLFVVLPTLRAVHGPPAPDDAVPGD